MRKMKKVVAISTKPANRAAHLVRVLTLECGHEVTRGGSYGGGFKAYDRAEFQTRATCPICNEKEKAFGSA